MSLRVMTDQIAAFECGYALVVKLGTPIIVFVREFAGLVDVVASDDIHACVH